jgi:hypothetical protein
MSAAISLEDGQFCKQAVAEAKADYDKALAEWKSASREDKPDYKDILDKADKQLESAQESLRAFLRTLGSVEQRASSPGAHLGLFN